MLGSGFDTKYPTPLKEALAARWGMVNHLTIDLSASLHVGTADCSFSISHSHGSVGFTDGICIHLLFGGLSEMSCAFTYTPNIPTPWYCTSSMYHKLNVTVMVTPTVSGGWIIHIYTHSRFQITGYKQGKKSQHTMFTLYLRCLSSCRSSTTKYTTAGLSPLAWHSHGH